MIIYCLGEMIIIRDKRWEHFPLPLKTTCLEITCYKNILNLFVLGFIQEGPMPLVRKKYEIWVMVWDLSNWFKPSLECLSFSWGKLHHYGSLARSVKIFKSLITLVRLPVLCWIDVVRKDSLAFFLILQENLLVFQFWIRC